MKKMNNTERYRSGFDNLHLSEDFRARLSERLEKEREDEKMKNIGFWSIGHVAAAIAICTLTFGSVCYAADLGGIRTNISMWINGQQEDLEVTDMGDGTYVWTDDNGDNHSFGGYTYTDGEIEAMSTDEMVSFMNNSATLEFAGDRIIFHYHNLSEDVTDLIDPDGKLYIHVEDPANPNTYFRFEDIKPDGTYDSECLPEPGSSVGYYEADASDLISGTPVEELDEDTAISYTTVYSED